MTVQSMPWAIQGASHPAENARNVLGAMFGVPVAAHTAAASVTTAGGGHGVVGATDLAVSQNGTPNMSVNVAAGRAIVRSGGTSSLLAASYAFLNDATVNVSIAAADPTNPRRDLVIAQVRDTNYGEAANDARITVVTGTPAASPSDPALTSYPNCVVLARVAVAAAATTILTANITDLRTRATALGGRVACTSTTRPTGASLFNGLGIWETDTFRSLDYDGTGWVIMAEPAQAHTPTLTNITLGNGSLAFAYHRSDGWCDLYGRFTLGSTSSIGGQMGFSLPVAGNTSFSSLNGSILIQDTGTALYAAFGYLTSTSRLDIYAMNAAGTYTALTATSATVPHTWANTDVIDIAIRYRMTTRYS